MPAAAKANQPESSAETSKPRGKARKAAANKLSTQEGESDAPPPRPPAASSEGADKAGSPDASQFFREFERQLREVCADAQSIQITNVSCCGSTLADAAQVH